MFFTLFKDRDDKEAPFDKEDASVGTEEE